MLFKKTDKSQKDDSEKPKNKKQKGGFMFKIVADVVSESDDDIKIVIPKSTYKYPTFTTESKKKTDNKFSPFGTQWIHDKQKDDEIDKKTKNITSIVDKLMKIEYPEQRSPEWFALRDKRTTASDGGCVVGVNEHEPPYKFLIKKVKRPPFESNMFCYHGTKFEAIATMIYEYRMNVKVEDFGLVAHPKINFLAASPDGIVGKYKFDGKSLTKHIGRMLEIKCPARRKIKQKGEIKGEICPIYYWVQVQLQLECCNLEECDFWQCDIQQYENREDFNNDTDENEPFRSKTTGMEKGCLIQLLPKDKIKEASDGKYWDIVYESSKFIYPPKIEMSPIECDIWIAETMANFSKKCMKEYYFDKVIYWKLAGSNCSLILRDKNWFEEKLPEFAKMWKYVEYLRTYDDKSTILFEYIESLPTKSNSKIMKIVDFICNEPDDTSSKSVKEYTTKILQIKEETILNKKRKDENEDD